MPTGQSRSKPQPPGDNMSGGATTTKWMWDKYGKDIYIRNREAILSKILTVEPFDE